MQLTQLIHGITVYTDCPRVPLTIRCDFVLIETVMTVPGLLFVPLLWEYGFPVLHVCDVV